MIVTQKIREIENILKKYDDIEYRIINNTLSKNLIFLSDENKNLLKELNHYQQYIQEIISEPNEDSNDPIIKEIKNICPKNSVVHRNISYINWSDRNTKINKIKNVIAGYSFKGGMGRSTTLSYLAYFYYLLGKKIVILDCDFEAPGIASIFFDKKKREEKAGVLDYLIDLNIEENPKLDDYFLQSEVSDNSGNLYLFPSGINYNIGNYLNKISKIDFNSKSYTKGYTTLLTHINELLKPDLIFIDLRAGINESNGLILKSISNTNLLFFNSEEQNEDGLEVIATLLKDIQNNFIMNSTIRFSNSELRASKEKQLINFLDKKFSFKESIKIESDFLEKRIITVPYNSFMLENNDREEYRKFIYKEYNAYKTSNEIYIQDIIKTINRIYFSSELSNIIKNDISEINLTDILKKLLESFKYLTAMGKFDNEENLKYFYFKEDISKLVNEQIFLILGPKGSGKSALFEIFTKNYKSILSQLNINNNLYIAGFSKDISNSGLSKDYLKIVHQNSKENLENLERFWKFLTLYQLEEKEDIEDKYFKDIDDIRKSFMNIEKGLDVDRRLKNININLLRDDRALTLVYDELDVELGEYRVDFIDALVEFWRGNLYKYSQVRSKILLRNDIFSTLKIENKTHLDFNKYELKWNKKEILSLILKIIVTSLDENELDKISLLDIVKNKKNNEITKDFTLIKRAIYLIFGEKINATQSNISTMDNWIISQLSDGKGNITPRVIYKFLYESISKELDNQNEGDSKQLLKSFGKNYKDILYEVSKHRLTEYNEEYKGYDKYYKIIQKIGYRIFEDSEYKIASTTKNKKTYIKAEVIDEYIRELIESGFLSIKDEKTKTYQVANVYVPALEIKMNRQGRRDGNKSED